jgi:ribosomal-protein-alanine N-acetyltransferase
MTENESSVLCDSVAPLEAQTRRVVLRSLHEDDAAMYCDLYTDAEIMRFIGEPLSRPRALKSFGKALQLTRQRPIQSLYLAVVDRATQRTVGLCNIEALGARAETGIILNAASRAYGYATEALGSTVAMAFGLLTLDEVIVRIAEGHKAAEWLVRGLGFSRCGGSSNGGIDDGRRTWSVGRVKFLSVRGAYAYPAAP